MIHFNRRDLLGLSGAAAASAALGARVSASAAPHLPIGMNLAGVNDYEPGFPFRNLMLGARPWLTRNTACCGPWDTKKISSFEFDADGYPLESPVKPVDGSVPQEPFTIVPNVRKPGRYVVLYDGEGVIGGMLGAKVLSSQAGRVILHMTHDGRTVEGIAIQRSKRGDHVRNIRILPVEDEKADLAKNPFLQEFLDFCRPFHCLRFMDWTMTNGSLEETWSGRKRPSFYTMAGLSGDPEATWSAAPTPFERKFSGGVALEYIFQLCNMLQRSPWICVPHRADDDYIASLARMARDNLDPRLKIYLEYSNELWNWGFVQSGWMLRSRIAGDLVEARGGRAWDDPAKTKGSGHPERIGALFRRVFEIWEREFQGKDRERLRRVCAVQQAWIDASRRTAKWCASGGGADILAPAGYFGPSDVEYEKWARRGSALAASEVIADMKRVIARDAASWIRDQAAIARDFGLEYAVYEGGQHIQPKGQEELAYNAALGAAQTRPEMYDLYIENFRLHEAARCRLFCAFSSIGGQGSRFGSWGVLTHYGQPLSEAPKMRALLDSNTPVR